MLLVLGSVPQSDRRRMNLHHRKPILMSGTLILVALAIAAVVIMVALAVRESRKKEDS